MQEFIACPYCGKKFAAGRNTCPHCCRELPKSEAYGTFPMAHSKWKHIHKTRKKQWIILGIVFAVLITSTHLFMMRYCGAVGFLDAYSSMEYRAKKLGSLAQEPDMEIPHSFVSREALLAMEPQALWLEPEKLGAAHPELSPEELGALESVCQNELLRGISREACLEVLERQVSPESARKLLDYCQPDFQIQALRFALRSMGSENYSPSGLLNALELQGFTEEQAQYALQNCGADWALQTELSARSKLYYLEMSEKKLEDRLLKEGHDPEVIRQVIRKLNPDWNREALQEALRWDSPSHMKKTRQELEDHLQWHGYTQEQIQYAADLMKLPQPSGGFFFE